MVSPSRATRREPFPGSVAAAVWRRPPSMSTKIARRHAIAAASRVLSLDRVGIEHRHPAPVPKSGSSWHLAPTSLLTRANLVILLSLGKSRAGLAENPVAHISTGDGPFGSRRPPVGGVNCAGNSFEDRHNHPHSFNWASSEFTLCPTSVRYCLPATPIRSSSR